MIDTVRYANRLKAAGVEGQLAEEMAKALDDELIVSLLNEGPEEAGRKTTGPEVSFDRNAARQRCELDVSLRKTRLGRDQRGVLRGVFSRQLALPDAKSRYNPLALCRAIRAEYKRLREELNALAAIDKDWAKGQRIWVRQMRGLYFLLILLIAAAAWVWIPILLSPNTFFIGLLGTLFILAFLAYPYLHFRR